MKKVTSSPDFVYESTHVSTINIKLKKDNIKIKYFIYLLKSFEENIR